MSARDNAIIAPLCSLGCDRLMHRGKQIGPTTTHLFGYSWRALLCSDGTDTAPYEAKIERRDINVY